MYSIVNIIYGYPLSTNSDKDPKIPQIFQDAYNDEILKTESNYPHGFLSYYHGSSREIPCAFGVELGEFDECRSYLKVSNIKQTPTPAQIQEFDRLFANLPADVQAELKSRGEPCVFYLFSTS